MLELMMGYRAGFSSADAQIMAIIAFASVTLAVASVLVKKVANK